MILKPEQPTRPGNKLADYISGEEQLSSCIKFPPFMLQLLQSVVRRIVMYMLAGKTNNWLLSFNSVAELYFANLCRLCTAF